MNVGYTVTCRDGTADIRFQPEGRPGARPSFLTEARDDEARISVVLMGRLDYRDEAAARLPALGPRSGATDAELALAVYSQQGADGLKRLEGEFSLVVWDSRRRRLIGMRDPFGAWPLYWSVRDSVVAMGTDLRALAPANPEVDLEYVAEYLARPFVPSEVPCQRTAFHGVQRVLPGTLVEIGPDAPPRHHSYWDWASRLDTVREQRPGEIANRFHWLLDRAVRERMRGGRVGAHLSGGMDSSSVAVLARRAIAGSAGGDPLAAISLTYQAAELTAERSYIELVLEQGGPLESHFISADPAVGFDWFARDIPRHDEPYVGLWGLAANRLLVEAAERCRVGTVLTGVGGDEILTYRPLHIADLLRRGRLFAAFREASAWAEAQGQGVWSLFRKCGLEPLWPGSSRLSTPPWLSEDFVRQHRLRDRCMDFSRRLFAPPAESSEMLSRLAMTSGDWARWYLHAPLGINVSHPFLDARVVCYTLGIPRIARSAPGEPKPVLQAAMRGLLPEAILNRREKTGFNGPHSRGLARNLQRLDALIQNSRIRAMGLIDTNKLLAFVRRLAVGIGGRYNEWIDRTLALIAWADQR